MLNFDKIKIRKFEMLSILFITLLTIAKTIGLSSSGNIYILIFIFGTALSIFKFLNDKYTKKEIIILLSILMIGLVNFFIGKETTVLFSALVLLCLKNVRINKAIKIMFYVKLILFIAILFLTITNLVESNYLIFFRNGEFIKRYSLIYGHPNIAHLNLGILIVFWMYVFYDKLNIVKISIVEIINYVFYIFTVSRTGFLIISFFLLLVYLHKKSSFIKKFVLKVGSKYFILMFLVTIIFGFLYGKVSFMEKINSLTTNRIKFINYFIYNVKIPIIGKKDYGINLIDNGYISLLYNGGLFATIWFSFVNINTLRFLKKHLYEKELLFSIIFLTYCLAESFYLNAILNAGILFFSYFIFENSNFNENLIE